MNKKNLNDNGLVAIVSILFIIIIITVITLSLATLTRRELRQSLDEQLSSQALYAAESGINDAVKALDPLNTNRLQTNITNCDDISQSAININRVLGDNIRYTCVLIDQTPESIVTDVSTDSVKTYLLEDEAGTISSLNFQWKDINSSTFTYPECSKSTDYGCLQSYSSWGDRLGLLRFRLLPYPKGGSLTRNNNGSIDVTAYPGPITDYTSSANIVASKDLLLAGNCNNGYCEISLTGLANPGRYILQVYSYYKSSKLTITGNTTTATSATQSTQFSGAQAEIDATGAASDVLRRIKVNVPIGTFDSEDLPVFSVGSGDKLCKRFNTNSSSTSNSSDYATECPSL